MGEAVLDFFATLGSDQTEGLADLIAEDPLDTHPYLVLGDLLQARSDPRGELIAVQHARLERPNDPALVDSELELLEHHTQDLIGPTLAAHRHALDLRWYCGFVEYARIDPEFFSGLSTGALVRALLEEPCGNFVRDLSVGAMWPEPNNANPYYDDVLRVLGEVRPIALRSLILGSVRDAYDPPSDTAADLHYLDEHSTERLERLVVHGGTVRLSQLNLPRLKELAIITNNITERTLVELSHAHLPALERLNIWLGQLYMSDGWQAILKITAADTFPSLRHLAFQQALEADRIVDLVMDSALLKRLDTLGLALGTLSDDGARRIWVKRDAVRHLRLLNLQDNYISPSMQERLRTVCRVVRLGIQQDNRRERLINLLR